MCAALWEKVWEKARERDTDGNKGLAMAACRGTQPGLEAALHVKVRLDD